MSLREELNPEQYEAVMTVEGPVLVLAGAGSGKTRVVTYRIAHMVKDCGIPPYNILAITFTNKAANEMKDRVEKLVGEDVNGMQISTFHSLCGKLLRYDGDRLGYTDNFIIYDTNDTSKIIKQCMKELDIDSKAFGDKYFQGMISKAKEQMISAEDFAATINKSNPAERKCVEVYKLYTKRLKENNAMDFDDMIYNMVLLLRNNPDIRQKYLNRFRYVMVDEYQDTNVSQFELVSLLSSHGNLCVVGDDDQSIYGFRGADISNILDFEKQFSNCKVIKLEQNYRSTQKILDVANSVIAGNNGHGRKEKKLWSNIKDGTPIIRHIADNGFQESYFIADEISRLMAKEDFAYRDFAVLYRQNTLSVAVEDAMKRAGIPIKITGGHKFFERAEIKVVLNYLRLFQNTKDDFALTEIINFPKRGIGDASVEKAKEIAENENRSLLDIVCNADCYAQLSRSANAMVAFGEKYFELTMAKDAMGISEFIKLLLGTEGMGIIDEFERLKDLKSDVSAENKIDNLKQFISIAEEFEKDANEDADLQNSFTGFLEHLALKTDLFADETEGAEGEKDPENAVNLMTIHSAKGLEFPVVFIVGMDDGIFPSYRSVENGELAEERRICYVAITRAKKYCYLLNSTERSHLGQTSIHNESRFFNEISEDKVQYVNSRGVKLPCKPEKSASWGSYDSGSEEGGYGSYGGYRGYGSRGGYSGYNKGGNSYGGYNSYSGYENISKKQNPGGNYTTYGNKEDADANRTFYKNVQKGSSQGTAQGFGRIINSVQDADKFAAAKKAASMGDSNFKTGDRVHHDKFGDGTVTLIKSDEKGCELCEINFDHLGTKRLVLKYAKLKKI